MDNQEIQSGMKPRSIIQALLMFQDFLTTLERKFLDGMFGWGNKIGQLDDHIIQLDQKVGITNNDLKKEINSIWEVISDLQGDTGAIHSAQKELTQVIYDDIKMTKKMLGVFDSQVAKLNNGKTKKRTSRN